MLRGQVPQDRNQQEIVFDTIEEVDDMWTQLFFTMLNDDDYGELWYWGGERVKQFKSNFVEKWTRPFHEYDIKYPKCIDPGFIPNVIFCRGGFPEYHPILKRFPKAVKIYYGAGRRFLPQPGFFDYDIILQDSIEQVELCKEKFPEALTTLFIKPAADNIFYPIECKKKYDVCFPANAVQTFKGHKFVYGTVPKDIKLLNLGNRNDRYKYPSNVTSYRALRTEMYKNISKCKVGIVAANSSIDSCPRVIPEMLACGIPIVVLNGTRFWNEKYIISGLTGEFSDENNFWKVVKHVLNNVDNYNPGKYYERNLSLNNAAKFLRGKIDEISVQHFE